MSFILGILAGLIMPLQTSINTRLRRSLGSPFRASGVNFFVGLCFLVLLSFVMGDGIFELHDLAGLPFWMFLGGFCGVTVLTGNLLLFPVLGATQTICFPLFGQIVMGILIDTFGWFRGSVVPLTVWRVLGAVLVFAGVVIVAVSGKEKGTVGATGTSGKEHSELALWGYRLFGVSFGTLGAVQTAINGQLGTTLGSSVQSSIMNFLVGTLLLAIICLVLHPKNPKPSVKGPAWMWLGGLLGGSFVLFNVYLQHLLGTGLTVVLNLTGLTAGGLIVDKTGILESPKKPVKLGHIAGVVLMLTGAVLIRLL